MESFVYTSISVINLVAPVIFKGRMSAIQLGRTVSGKFPTRYKIYGMARMSRCISLRFYSQRPIEQVLVTGKPAPAVFFRFETQDVYSLLSHEIQIERDSPAGTSRLEFSINTIGWKEGSCCTGR